MQSTISLTLRSFKDGDGDTQSHKGVKASANSDIIFFFTSAQDGNKLLDDERLSLADDLKKAHDQNQNKSNGPHDTHNCMENPEQAFVEYASSRTDEAGVLEVLIHAPIYNAILDKYVESLELGKNGSTFVQGETPVKMGDPELFTLPCRLGDSKPFDTLANLGSCVNIILLYLFKKLNIGLLEETDRIFGLADETKSYPDPETLLLVERGFLATANAVIDCRMAKIATGEGITRKDFLDCHLPGEWEISRDAELNPFKDTLVFRTMDKPPKNRDGAWHAKIRLIDPDREEFTKTLQSIPTTRKLSERESPREIIDLDHFYDT
ncbi:hypothetical protein Tco_0944229 [Tanacetum coccineum]